MPSRTSTARRVTLVLYAHPFELAVLVLLALSPARKHLGPATLAQALDTPLVVVWDLVTIAGVIAALVGLVVAAYQQPGHPGRMILGRGIEKAGLWLLAAAQVATVITAIIETSPATAAPHAIATTALAGACLLRIVAIRKAETIEANACHA